MATAASRSFSLTVGHRRLGGKLVGALLSVVPEVRHLEAQILTGEPPDPTRVPGGCRFHPRCPALASGDAARAGVDDRCRNQAVPILRGVTEHHAACFLTDESVKKEAERRQSTRGAHAEGPQ
jgi:oligopeptide/dipeptide ABC transporter ATP-binding protein